MSKKLLIIYPHWPPSNLAGVHRARLIGNFLHEFNWKVTVLTVKPEFYEEQLDLDMLKTVHPSIQVEYVDAFPILKPRLIGDIGLRAFRSLYEHGTALVGRTSIDFLWIPIPSFYAALLGRLIHERTGIKYGIDYIDPWVRDISNRKNWRSKLSLAVAKWLEPIAVKKASLISGVAFHYYAPVLERNFGSTQIKVNPYTKLPFTHVNMPYGFDPNDHALKIENNATPWDITNHEPIVYAGAYLPNARLFMRCLFQAVAMLKTQNQWPSQKHFYFLGTGSYEGQSIADLANECGIGDLVTEIRTRYPFLQILNFLSHSFGVLVVGSTEKHYTASKTFQAVLSGRPILSIFHAESSAVECLQLAHADSCTVTYKPTMEEIEIREALYEKLQLFLGGPNWQPNLVAFNERYSAKESARILVEGIESIL